MLSIRQLFRILGRSKSNDSAEESHANLVVMMEVVKEELDLTLICLEAAAKHLETTEPSTHVRIQTARLATAKAMELVRVGRQILDDIKKK